MKLYFKISFCAKTLHCSLVGLEQRLNSKLTRVRTTSHLAVSSNDRFKIHSSTWEHQWLGISISLLDGFLEAEDPTAKLPEQLEAGKETEDWEGWSESEPPLLSKRDVTASAVGNEFWKVYLKIHFTEKVNNGLPYEA